MDSHLFKYRLKTKSAEAVQEWIQFANEHREAILDSLKSKGMSVENVFVEENGSDVVLYYYVRTENLKNALEQLKKSTDALTEYQKTFFNKVTATRTELKKVLSFEI